MRPRQLKRSVLTCVLVAVSFCTVVPVAAPATILSQGSPAPGLTSIEFDQYDWYREDGSLAQADSLWGKMSFSYTPDLTTWYLNVILANSSGGTEYWVIRNLPLFAVDSGDFAARREAADINLDDLGFSAGMNWSSTWYGYTVEAGPRSTAPTGAATSATVTDQDWDSWGLPSPGTAPFNDPGAPAGTKADTAATKKSTERDVKAVQEDVDHCMCGAHARSLDWLNREHELGSAKDAQGMYGDLKKAGVSKKEAGKPGDEIIALWIERKNAYARSMSDDKIVTKVWDGVGAVADIDGVAESSEDFVAWLEGELEKCEDVEVAWHNWDPATETPKSGAHIVTVTGAYVTGPPWSETTHVKYRDDEKQGDAGKGDTETKNAGIIPLPGGKYGFGGDGRLIYFAVSESVESESVGEEYKIPRDVETVTGDDRCVGVEVAWGHVWVTGTGHSSSGLNRQIHKFDLQGNYLASYPQITSSPVWGGRDLEADESAFLLYTGAEGGELAEYRFDPQNTHLSYVQTYWLPIADTIRALCLNRSTGHFFTKSFTGPMYEFDLGGAVFNTFVNPSVSAYGFGWDDVRNTIWSSDTGGSVTELDPATGQATGQGFTTTLGGAQGGADVFLDGYGNHGRLSLVMLHQGTPDSIGFYNLTDTPNTNTRPLFVPPALVAGSSATLEVRDAGAGDLVIFAYSLTGSGSMNTSWGILRLSPPFVSLPPVLANGTGVATLPMDIPLNAVGIQVWLQALDLQRGELSNGVTAVVQ